MKPVHENRRPWVFASRIASMKEAGKRATIFTASEQGLNQMRCSDVEKKEGGK